MKLAGKVAVVTGAGYGIGRGIAIRFAGEGAKVVVNYRHNKSRAEETRRLIADKGGVSLAVQADVSDAGQVAAMTAMTIDSFGQIDILVNNAGIFSASPILEMSEEDWDRVIDTDLKGTFLCCRAVGREMVGARRGGRIINISSVHGDRPQDGLGHYAAAKAGVVNLSKALALELAPHRITVNAISPGAIWTGMFEDGSSDPSDWPRIKADVGRKIPWGRVGEPEDVAGLAAFLASDEADYCTGANFIVDGGFLLVHPGI